MILMDENMASALLCHRLTELHFNLDGATDTTYRYIKGHNHFSLVRHNIAQFASLRNQMNSKCRVQAYFITAKQFAEEIEGKGGLFKDDSEEIVEFMKPMLHAGDNVGRVPILLHKYRHILDHRRSEPCEEFGRILREVYVAPNGQAYICCLDFGQESSMGNINDSTLAELWSSSLRENSLRNIWSMRYERTFEVW
jgi:hypothetical protein